MKCECGGVLKDHTLKTYNFSYLAGFPVQVQLVPGLRCSTCKWETLEGDVINSILQMLTRALVGQPSTSQPDVVRFLRKRLRMTPQALADRLGVPCDAVEKWEGQGWISSEHDQQLRELIRTGEVGGKPLITQSHPKSLVGVKVLVGDAIG